ncbi:MAG: hypothetical protein CMJ58_06715 [Planctomycetaceae bacterium]|nr:hypothetical protein [Planctomycetaceae bacterium]
MDESQQRRRLLIVTIAAVSLWGLLLAFGSYLGIDRQTPSRDAWRFAIMAACSGAFVGGWLLALWVRARRQRRK